MEYTRDAIDFFTKNQGYAKDVLLKNKKPGFSIKIQEGGVKQGGYWSKDEKIITYWD